MIFGLEIEPEESRGEGLRCCFSLNPPVKLNVSFPMSTRRSSRLVLRERDQKVDDFTRLRSTVAVVAGEIEPEESPEPVHETRLSRCVKLYWDPKVSIFFFGFISLGGVKWEEIKARELAAGNKLPLLIYISRVSLLIRRSIRANASSTCPLINSASKISATKSIFSSMPASLSIMIIITRLAVCTLPSSNKLSITDLKRDEYGTCPSSIMLSKAVLASPGSPFLTKLSINISVSKLPTSYNGDHSGFQIKEETFPRNFAVTTKRALERSTWSVWSTITEPVSPQTLTSSPGQAFCNGHSNLSFPHLFVGDMGHASSLQLLLPCQENSPNELDLGKAIELRDLRSSNTSYRAHQPADDGVMIVIPTELSGNGTVFTTSFR
ncbi:hypothetical protein F2Q70_00026857 [Brassica cretica]|uniref:Uncharacterized protein n=1 Tax=Brassica cretica TaxID=69181 RepID=A0A8S9LHN2_BRACR|nr:hypothetical protein F2Q70_00026857 [Brassica cretica]